MPSIPVTSALGYVAVFLLIAGLVLILAGFGILKIEKVTITTGRATWLFGVLLASLGFLLLYFENSKSTTATTASSTTPTAILVTSPTVLPTTVIPTTIASTSVTNIPTLPTPTIPTSTPTPSSSITLVPPTLEPSLVPTQDLIALYNVITSAPYSYQSEGGSVQFVNNLQGGYDFSYDMPISGGNGGFQFESKPPVDLSVYKNLQLVVTLSDLATKFRVTLKDGKGRGDILINQNASLSPEIKQVINIDLTQFQSVNLSTVSHVIISVNQSFTTGKHSIHITSINLVK